jgi:hypothetical protein
MRSRTWFTAALALGTITLAGAAQAQESSPAENTPPPRAVPPAAQPLVTSVPRPTFALDVGTGARGYLGGTAAMGPLWNVRVTGYFTPRWAAEANYTGAVNQRSDNTGDLIYTALDAALRYSFLRADQAPVVPYVAAGMGVAFYSGPGNGAGLTVPLAVGVERDLTRNIRVGARFQLRPAFLEDLAALPSETNQPGGDTWSVVANVGGQF